MSAWRFRPAPWAWAVFLALVALLATLGTWQVERAIFKERMQARLLHAEVDTPADLQAVATPPAAGDLRRVRARGRYDAQRQLLLDNQSHARRPGYHVWTPLRLPDGSLAIVDRGWVAQDPDRRILPDLSAPGGDVELTGYWRTLPEPGLRLGSGACADRHWPNVVQYPDAAELDCLYGEPVRAGLLLLEPSVPGGYVRDWATSVTGLPPQRHYAYAAQWYALCVTLVVLFVRVNLRKHP